MRPWGDLVLEVVSAAAVEVRFVAPFVKQDVLSRILRRARDGVSVTIFTRWRPDEVACGVSDLEVLDVVHARPRTALRLCASLHAKYYRADGTVLLGSANLTRAALGWSAEANLELLFRTTWPTPELQRFEETLADMSVEATDEMRDRVAAAAKLFRVPPPVRAPGQMLEPQTTFLPRTRNPELLFAAYAGSAEELTTAAREQVARDLTALALPGGLREDEFNQFVGVLLMQAPTIAALDRFVAQPRRFGEVRMMLSELLATHRIARDPEETWQTVMRWLLHFLPGRYHMAVHNYSEVFRRQEG